MRAILTMGFVERTTKYAPLSDVLRAARASVVFQLDYVCLHYCFTEKYRRAEPLQQLLTEIDGILEEMQG